MRPTICTANLAHGGSRRVDPGLTRWPQVTHYYFDERVYYPPIESDPFYGRIRYRRQTNIATGKIMPNIYSGRQVPPSRVLTVTYRTSYKHLWESVRSK